MEKKEIAEALRMAFAGTMSEKEIQFFRDMQAFIEFAIRNDLSFRATMAYLSHDWNEFARDGFDFETVMKHGFSPRVDGWSKATPDAVGEPEEPVPPS